MKMKTASTIIALLATLALAAPVPHVPDGVSNTAENGKRVSGAWFPSAIVTRGPSGPNKFPVV